MAQRGVRDRQRLVEGQASKTVGRVGVLVVTSPSTSSRGSEARCRTTPRRCFGVTFLFFGSVTWGCFGGCFTSHPHAMAADR